MRTEAAGRALALALAVAGAQSCCGTKAYTGGAVLDVSDYPAEIQHAYVVFAANCSKCHSLSRPLSARIDDVAYWDLYVARMMRMPGSGISTRETPEILTFLYYYTGEVKGHATGGDDARGDGAAPPPDLERPPPEALFEPDEARE